MIEDKVRLYHIRDAIQRILHYTKGCDYEAFCSNKMLFDACCRQLEILGEAANGISKKLEKKHPAVPWPAIVGLRNVLIHQYFGVDERTVWDVVQSNLPDLHVQITGIIEGLEKE